MPDISSLLSQLTLEEKASLCTGAGPWKTVAIERLGIPSITVTDGPNGVRRTSDINNMASKSLPATCFPSASCVAASWDVDLARQMGAALGEECVALGVDVLLGPGNNIKRSPLGGRNFEYMSEDPFLAGEMAASWIEGVQSQGVGTSLKHFAVNNQEFQRFSINAVVDERALREIYLAAFERAVKKAQPWTVMCAYNKVNGYYCSEHHELLTDILKNEWGFQGFVVSDWGAVHDRPASLAAGLDLEMPGPQAARVQAVVDAVQAGTLSEAALNESVRRILEIVFRATATPKGSGSFDQAAHHNLARQIAAEGMVLLKNNGILPLKSPQHIAVIGKTAQAAHFQGGGSAHVNPTVVDVPYVEIQRHAPEAELTFAEGYPADHSISQSHVDEAVAVAQAADVALLYLALPASKESEGYDRPDLELTPPQIALIEAVARVQPNTIVILNNGAPIQVRGWIDKVAALLEGWMMGQAGAGAIADILFGTINPSGRLAETFPVQLEDTPAHLNWPGENGAVRYGEGLYVGYRGYDARKLRTQYPFGYGLSYTTFAYGNLRLSASNFKDSDGLTVMVDVTNTGAVTGKEVVQLYVGREQTTLRCPPKQLKAFTKLELAPGQTKTATLTLDSRAFAYWHPAHHEWVVESGPVTILIGASAEDIRLSATAQLESTQNLPSLLNETSTIREWLTDRRGQQVFGPMFQKMGEQMHQQLSGEGGEVDTIGMDMMGFMMDMPLTAILYFQASALPAAPEVIVAGMLAQVKQIP